MTKQDSQMVIERLVAASLELIDLEGSCMGVNLRQIARKMGFAHTNVYNYFSSYEDLLWAALKGALKQLMKFTQKKVKPEQTAEEDYLPKFIQAQIDFALEHPGWYQFIWLDHWGDSEAKKDVVDFSRQFENRFIEIIYVQSRGKLSGQEAEVAANLIHGYMHGEICKMLGGRFLDTTRGQYSKKIFVNTITLIESLLKVKLITNKEKKS